jgi:hypothetical protein
MDTKITFRVLGVDFDDDATVEMIATHLSDLAWATIDGVTWATLFIGADDIADQAIDAARRIEHRLQGSQVDQLDEEPVAGNHPIMGDGLARPWRLPTGTGFLAVMPMEKPKGD